MGREHSVAGTVY